jgi:transposase-like protein
MTKQTRRKFTPEFKAKVALEAAKEQLTLAQLSQKFEVNAVTISKWKSEFLANLSSTFSNVKEMENSEPEVPVEKLYAQIGKLKVELDFLKKVQRNWGYPRANGSHQTKKESVIVAQTMRVALCAEEFTVLCANT